VSKILKIKDFIASTKGGQFIPIEFNYTTLYEKEQYDIKSDMDIYKVRRLKDDEIFVSDIDCPLVKITWTSEDGFKMNRIVYIDHFYDDFIHVELCAWTYSDCFTVTASIEELIEINDLDDDFLTGMRDRARIDFKQNGYISFKS